MTRRIGLRAATVLAALLAGCEISSATPSPSFAGLASPSTSVAPTPAATPSPIELPREIATWCRQHVEDVYAVTEGLGIPSDPRPFRLPADDDLRWAPVEGSRNYQVGCTAAYEERASAAPS